MEKAILIFIASAIMHYGDSREIFFDLCSHSTFTVTPLYAVEQPVGVLLVGLWLGLGMGFSLDLGLVLRLGFRLG